MSDTDKDVVAFIILLIVGAVSVGLFAENFFAGLSYGCTILLVLGIKAL